VGKEWVCPVLIFYFYDAYANYNLTSAQHTIEERSDAFSKIFQIYLDDQS